MIARPMFVGVLLVAGSASVVAQRSEVVENGLPRFVVASVKQNTGEPGPPLIDGRTFRNNGRMTVTNMSLFTMIQVLFRLNDPNMLIEGGPQWLQADRFDIVAQGDPGTDAVIPAGQPLQRMNEMLHSLLTDRFNLRTHVEHRPMQVYALMPVDSKQPAAQLRSSKTTDCAAVQDDPNARCGMRRVSATGITAVGVTLDQLALQLSAIGRFIGLDRPVENRTGIAGRFDIDVMVEASGPALRGAVTPSAVVGGPEQGSLLITMLRDQLGLALRSVPGERDVLVIDHAERPQPD